VFLYRKFQPLFFWPEQYRRAGELSIAFRFYENPGVASVVRAMPRLEALDLFPVGDLAQAQTDSFLKQPRFRDTGSRTGEIIAYHFQSSIFEHGFRVTLS